MFIDESGDFGEAEKSRSYYLVTLVYHDQEVDIKKDVLKLEDSVKASGFDIEYIHTGPVIRREELFANYSIDERRKLLYKMLNFYHNCNIRHTTVTINRKEAPDKMKLSGKLARAIGTVIEDKREFFSSYDTVIVYYDNGQNELSRILNIVFSMHFSNVEFRKAAPQQYRLLQLADVICTFELLRIKQTEKRLSKSEEKCFYKPQELKKTFLKSITKKRLEND